MLKYYIAYIFLLIEQCSFQEPGMKTLLFNVKRNLKKPPKIYVLSPDKKITFGSFSSDNPSEFTEWNSLNLEQTVELKQYMQNMRALSNHFESSLNEQMDFRLRLPMSFIQCVNDISALAIKNDLELDIFEPMITSMIQQLKIILAKLPFEEKQQALAMLNKIGLAEYKKIDFSNQIQAVFSELLLINRKSEKLEIEAKQLFNKVKRITRKSLEDIAQGHLDTPLWVVACAIEILLHEQSDILKKTLSEDDLFMLWAKQLLDRGHEYDNVLHKAHSLGREKLINKIEQYFNMTHAPLNQ